MTTTSIPWRKAGLRRSIGRISRGHLPGCHQAPAVQPNANRNDGQAENEEAGQEEIEDEADVGIRRTGVAEDGNDPEADQDTS